MQVEGRRQRDFCQMTKGLFDLKACQARHPGLQKFRCRSGLIWSDLPGFGRIRLDFGWIGFGGAPEGFVGWLYVAVRLVLELRGEHGFDVFDVVVGVSVG